MSVKVESGKTKTTAFAPVSATPIFTNVYHQDPPSRSSKEKIHKSMIEMETCLNRDPTAIVDTSPKLKPLPTADEFAEDPMNLKSEQC